MIGKQVVKETIMALEDMLDLLTSADSPDMQRAAEVQSLLNFWRMYVNFLPEEES